jgi:hypothetical protein
VKPATALLAALAPLAVAAQPATELRLQPVADATIFGQLNGSTAFDATADGRGESLWTSVIASGTTRRALLRFDLSALPPGARVQSVRLELFEIRARDEHVVRVHRVLAPWSEGPSNGGDAGVGAAAQPGDVTWSHRSWPNVPWAARGGDFAATASASQTVGFGPALYVWPSTPQLVADVQGWLANPGTNHGWIVVGDDKGLQNAKRFGSRENESSAGRPTLVVGILPAAVAADGDVPLPPWALALVATSLAAALWRRRG